jgi:CHAT domain-containing protein
LLGRSHPYTIACKCDLAMIKGEIGEYAEAISLFTDANKGRNKVMRNVMGFGSERGKLAYLMTLEKETTQFLTFLVTRAPRDPVAVKEGLNLVLNRKGISLEALSYYQNAFVGYDDEARKILKELRYVKGELVRAYYFQPSMREGPSSKALISRLEGEKERLEDMLSRTVDRYALEKKVSGAVVESVSAMMPKRSALVEFVRSDIISYPDSSKQKGGVRTHYLAFVLRAMRDADVVLVDLGDAQVIDGLIREYRIAVKERSERVYDLAGKLYETVVRPWETYVSNTQYVFVSPHGGLCLLPFETLLKHNGRFLIEDYVFHYIPSGRDLMRVSRQRSAKRDAIILAAPDFDNSDEGGESTSGTIGSGGPVLFTIFKDLPGTRQEADSVEGILSKRFAVRKFVGKNATERVLYSVERPAILHIASHGFFLTDNVYGEPNYPGLNVNKKEAWRMGPGIGRIENPMMRSGIVLAGANKGIRDGTGAGLLCAEKVTTINLVGTDLVVLSACDTGVGEISNFDGILGLQRAFLVAGASTLFATLWPVPDVETKEIMVRFYSYYVSGVSKLEALRRARLKQMEMKRHPFYWGGFICVGYAC